MVNTEHPCALQKSVNATATGFPSAISLSMFDANGSLQLKAIPLSDGNDCANSASLEFCRENVCFPLFSPGWSALVATGVWEKLSRRYSLRTQGMQGWKILTVCAGV